MMRIACVKVQRLSSKSAPSVFDVSESTWVYWVFTVDGDRWDHSTFDRPRYLGRACNGRCVYTVHEHLYS